VFSGPVQPFAKGQVFLSTGDGMIFVYSSSGTLVQVLNSGNIAGNIEGMAFDGTGNLYAANSSTTTVAGSSGIVEFFGNTGAGPTTFGTGFTTPKSVVVDSSNNVYVGQAITQGDRLLQFSGVTGKQTATFFPAYENNFSGIDWIDLRSDGDTLIYTLGTKTVKTFDVADVIQLPDLVTNLNEALALRALSDGTVLVADTIRIVRLDVNGNVTQTYTIPGAAGAVFFNLNLDPDGVTFWTADQGTGIVYRLNIATGAVVSQFNTSLGSNSLLAITGIGGIAVSGEPQAGAGADLGISMTAAPNPVGTGSNLTYSITVSNVGPDSAQAATVTDVLPAGVTFVSSTASIGSCSGTTTVTCTLGTFANGATATITIVVTPAAAGTLTNTVNVTSSSPDPIPSNNTATTSTTVTGSGTTVQLTALTAGTGTGMVTGNGINCTSGSTNGCVVNLAAGTQVVLTATPTGGSSLGGFSAPCTGTGTMCTFSMPATPVTVTVTFNAAATNQTLTVITAGTGTGMVTGAGISCTTGSANGCTASLPAGTQVVLTQAITNNSTFAGWNGVPTSCTVAGATCTFTMPAAAETVTATFTAGALILKSIAVTPSTANIGVNGTQPFTATGTFSDNSTKDVTTQSTWTSSNTEVATVGAGTGIAKGVGVGGPVTITATDAGISGTAQLTVSNVPFTLTINPPPGGVFGPVAPGGTFPVGVILTAIPGTTGTVTFGCTTSSLTITCSPQPSSVALSPNGPLQVAIVVNTFCKGPTTTGHVVPPGGFGGGIGLLLLSMMLAGTAWMYRRNPRWAVSFALFVLIALGGVACNSLPRNPNGVTQPGNYQLFITATFNGQTVSAPAVNFVVN
jgi:uncharacterized repeat protein (TIGR01451 family)